MRRVTMRWYSSTIEITSSFEFTLLYFFFRCCPSCRSRMMEDVLQLLSPYCDGHTSLNLAMTCREGAVHFSNKRHRYRALREKKLALHPMQGIPMGLCSAVDCTYRRAESMFMNGHGRVVMRVVNSLYCPRCARRYTTGSLYM